MIALRNSMWSTDKVNDHFTERQNFRVSHGAAHNANIWEACDIISLDIQVNLMDSIYARFQRCL